MNELVLDISLARARVKTIMENMNLSNGGIANIPDDGKPGRQKRRR